MSRDNYFHGDHLDSGSRIVLPAPGAPHSYLVFTVGGTYLCIVPPGGSKEREFRYASGSSVGGMKWLSGEDVRAETREAMHAHE